MLRRLTSLLAVLAFILTACGGSSAPALTDPKDILSKSTLALKDIKTLHVDVDIAGKVSINTSSSSPAQQFDLAGTKATLDLDIAGQKVKATLLIPALLNSGAELLVVDKAAYYKLSGAFANFAPGDKYTKVPLPDLSNLAGASPAANPTPSLTPQKIVDMINEALGKLPTPPTKGADEKCGDTDCYHVTLKVTAADVAALASPADVPVSAITDVSVDVWTRKNDLRPAKFVIAVNAGAQGSVTITMNATYDGAVTIAAPPADQVQEGTLPFPMASPSSAP